MHIRAILVATAILMAPPAVAYGQTANDINRLNAAVQICNSPMGAGTPSHSSRERHPCPSSMPAPPKAGAPAARASRTRRVGLGR